jgi:hypothetical protein
MPLVTINKEVVVITAEELEARNVFARLNPVEPSINVRHFANYAAARKYFDKDRLANTQTICCVIDLNQKDITELFKYIRSKLHDQKRSVKFVFTTTHTEHNPKVAEIEALGKILRVKGRKLFELFPTGNFDKLIRFLRIAKPI